MAFKRTNRWDVQVVFPGDAAFGMKNRTDVEQTPETVCDALEEFCQRARRAIARKAATQSSGDDLRERVAK